MKRPDALAARLVLVALAWLALAAPSPVRASGFALERLPPDVALDAGDAVVAGRHDAAFESVDDGLVGSDTRGGRWYRLVPDATWRHGERPLLALYSPYANRVVVRAPPDYAPVARRLGDPDADPRWSRHALVVELTAGLSPRTPVYVYVERGRRFPMRVAIEHPAAFAAADVEHVRLMTALLTALAVMAIVVAFFGVVLREIEFALLGGALVFQLAFLLFVTGEAYAIPGLRGLGSVDLPAIWLTRSLGVACLFAFAARFLALDRHAPRLDRALRAASWSFVALAVLSLLPVGITRSWLPWAGNVLLFAATVAALVAALVVARRGVRTARFFLLAWLPTLCLDVLRESRLLGFAPPWPPNEYVLPGAMAFAGVVFSLGLADRLLAVRRERDAARRDAERDALTGVLNRTALAERLAVAVDVATSEHRALSLLFLDLDRFKQVNDTWGHATGDACLLAVVEEIALELRHDDSVARYGGEEFVVILPGAAAVDAAAVAERIRARVARRCLEVAGRPVKLTVSIGIAEFGEGTLRAEQLLAEADAALYAAKAAGRDRVEVRARAA